VRVAGQRDKALAEAFDEAVGHLRVATLSDDEIPDVVKVRFGFERKPVRQLLQAGLLGSQTGRPRAFT
jgi:hypothetical protein